MRQRIAAVALDIAKTEEQLAAAFQRIAERTPSRAAHLIAAAAAARNYAESERQFARRMTDSEWLVS